MQQPINVTEHRTDAQKLARSAGSVGVAVFLSRIMGVVREQVFAWLFGAGMAADAFVVAFRIPNLLRDLFAEGALSSAFVTVFTDYEKNRSAEDLKRLVNNVFTVMGVVVALVVTIEMLFSWELVQLMAQDFKHVVGKIELTTLLTLIMAPFLLFVSQAAIAMGILNTKGLFFIPAFSSACFNIGSIVVGAGLAMILPHFGINGIIGMAIGTLAGGIMQFLIQVPLLKKQGFHIKPAWNLTESGLRRIFRLMVPAIIGLSATQINIFVNTNFASQCAEGSVAWLNYAFRFMLFPIGLFGVAMSVASMPSISRMAASKDMERLKGLLHSSLILCLGLAIPASVGLFLLAEPIIRLIYEHGRFVHHDTIMTAQALELYAIGLTAYAGVKIIAPVFYALNDTRWPVVGSFLAVVFNILFILVTLRHLEHRSIALATSISATANLMLLMGILHKKIGGFQWKKLGIAACKMGIASIGMGIVVWLTKNDLHGYGFWRQGLGLMASIVLGALFYTTAIYVLNVPELKVVIAGIGRRLMGSAS